MSLAAAPAAISANELSEPIDLGTLTLAPDAQYVQLSNGMDVVIIPDRRAPIVTHMVWYRVGSADEPPGKSGIAHYLEHLMFKGTENHPGDMFSTTIARLGGRENAFTSNDYTAYFQQVAKEQLPTMMRFEADRMKGLVLSEEVSAPELNVVLEERRQRVETRPGAELAEALDAALFTNHPYGDPVIGWPHEVAALTYQDALDFYRDHYRPKNAILVVAGDVDVAEITALAEEIYGSIPDEGAAPVRERPPIMPIRAKRTVELTDERVREPYTQESWLVPSYTTAEDGVAEAIDLLAEVLGGGNTSRLYTKLVREEGIATSAGAYYQSTAFDDTRFVAYAVPQDGVALQDLEARIAEVIGEIATDGITELELRRAKTNTLSAAVFAQDSQSTMARMFGAGLTTGSTVEDIQNWPAGIAAVTEEDVQEAAKALLAGQPSVTARLLAPATAE